MLCAFDVSWMRAIDPEVSGLRAERTSLMSLGDEECRIAVLETTIRTRHTAKRSSSASPTRRIRP